VGVRLQARELTLVITTADADAVDGNAVAKKLFDSVAVGVDVGLAVIAVRDEENNLAAVAATVFEELRGFIDRIVQRFCGPIAEDNG